ncbi:MAG: triose-phosphate isomerase [Gemmatimonadetes bacterium]|nr:triose-phosphate isomerase [Gemmatimonadota bacterium]NIR78110.1 triose-phosphate isomerase [Gemmatimonadota bacterium]NIT86677.1 triose-phosphate isomerase [Gemmatimonadota bacterium]NIU30530.1 triose-phosphate isomerase [Gemmatimonadota bacterium]NIU35369.1 triose-phosphate isomerase [Gemmatimonadota bacterium]
MSTEPVIAGNWKMHHGPGATRRFFGGFRPEFDGDPPTLLVFPPTVSLAAARESLPETPPVCLGIQNIHWEDAGAYTGEISAGMAAEAGATHVLIGHSERRHVFGETDDEVALKVDAALGHGLVPVVCVGETLEERRAGRVEEVILRQLDVALGVLAGREHSGFMLAYEPVWAIGTGETATPDDASAAHGGLRKRLVDTLESEGDAGDVPILYGGSVKPHNARELLDAPDVDGVLVGGASLEADSFAAIATA